MPPGVLAISGDLKAPVLALKNQLAGSGKDIWLMGGGQAIDAMFAAGLVDRLELSIMPILLGDGIPFFLRHDRGDRPLRLIETRSLSNGIVTVTYEPTATA
ncbi:MAG: dihydrofolate reductase family protein [Phycisphaerales bacterium]|nr:dihydrofolate reductase family protein [Phycisphaerales bacterium]